MTNPTPTPTAPAGAADVVIVSITPSVTQAKVGDTVVFTIVAQNYGPGPADYMWVNADVTGDNP
ncbi:MAG: hypothetical protein ACXVSF_15915, partial [Solirubrobacteraceae bacterium]